MAIYTYIVMYGDFARETGSFLVYAHLKDVLGHLQTKWHVQEMVPAILDIKHGQVERFLIEMYASEVILNIQLAEAGITIELMRDLIKHRGFIMLLQSGLVKVLWEETYV